jgi:hypothetical protein
LRLQFGDEGKGVAEGMDLELNHLCERDRARATR